ncbi:helix-turn-helix transcriptional regulator [Nocardioides pantholopis]|uniref:helix-turn-helix transcriptional regulator n=1 Tax=Nocardioides pantholopis TaxID=2483798 RepID=UPI000F0848F6|nr:response regulator transcription factor [Nocardioides pantholopis]
MLESDNTATDRPAPSAGGSSGGRTRPIRVALSNDYELVLHGIAAMLAGHEEVEVVQLTTAREVADDVDVVLYDTFGRLPEHDDKLRQIVVNNDALVIVYSWRAYSAEEARRRGAAGYLSKGMTADELVAGIVAVYEGRPPAPWPAAAEGADGADGADNEGAMRSWPGQDHGLSAREAEMLTFITRGLTNEEITRQAYLSVNTVKTYIRTAYRKIGVTSRAQAVAWGMRHGFDTDQSPTR